MSEDLATELAAQEGELATPVPGALALAEPAVKLLLAEHGIAVPRAEVVGRDGMVHDLDGPLVLKAFGPGIVHKTDVGAVRLGLTRPLPWRGHRRVVAASGTDSWPRIATWAGRTV